MPEMPQENAMITLTDVAFSYGSRQVLAGVNLTFRPNEVSGLLGLNGAGKSTLLRIITGCIAPRSGTVEIQGRDISADRSILSRVGYLAEIPPLYADLTVIEQLIYAARLKKLLRPAHQARQVLALTNIENVSQRLIGNLSKGYRQRVGIAQSLLGDPAVVVLDEPTVGLDPEQIAAVHRLIREIAANRTVIFSSHILSEVQALCDRVAILAQGRVKACGSLQTLTAAAETKVVVTFGNVADRDDMTDAVASLESVAAIETLAGVSGTETMLLSCQDSYELRQRLFDLAVSQQWSVLELRPLEHGLDEVFAAYAENGKES